MISALFVFGYPRKFQTETLQILEKWCSASCSEKWKSELTKERTIDDPSLHIDLEEIK
jgi:hypothetical protein